MIVQRTFLGGRRWTRPWRIRVDTMAGGKSRLTTTNYMRSGSEDYPIITNWGDGTQTVSKDIASHTYASDGDYVISHYSLDNFDTAYLKVGSHKNIVEVIDPFPRLPSVGDGYYRTFYEDDYLQAIPSNLFDNNADFITNLSFTFYNIKGGPLRIPSGLFKSLTKLSNISNTFNSSVLDYIPDGLFEGMTTLLGADKTFESAKASYSGNRIFAGCTGLTSIAHCFNNAKIPVFGDDTFNGCTGVTRDNTYTFRGITSTKNIGARTFANCTNIIQGGYNFSGTATNRPTMELESIGDYTWQNCTSFTNIDYFLQNVPKLKTLPPHTFSGCTKLNSFGYIFQDAPALGAMDLYMDSCPTDNSSSFQGVPDMTPTTQRVIHVLSGCTITSGYPNKYRIAADR